MAVGTAAISRTPAATGNRKTWTLSYWVKRGDLANIQQIWNCYDSSSDYMYMRFTAANELYLESETGNVSNIGFTTNRLFQDPGAWYHIVLAVDTAQVTSTDRWKVYINGVDEADTGGYSASDYSSQDVLTSANTDTFALYIGADHNTAQGFNGEMSHVQMVDGLALAPTEFGEFDSTSGIWKIKTGSYATPGTNGFHLKMEDRTNLDLDSSSNAFTFTTTGTLTATYDNPSNNFCTGNPLDAQANNINYTTGNNTIYDQNSTWRSAYGTLGDNTGKYYFETKIVGSSGNWWVGFCDADQVSSTDAKFVAATRGYGVNSAGNRGNSGSEASWTGEIATAQNEVVMVAIDMVNGKIYFGSEGVWMASGDPTSGSTGTGAAYSITTGKVYLPAFSFYSTTAGVAPNFGNGYFGTTAITSAGTNASGIGEFEFDVPTGYTALSTKGFNV
jgi:hypothetical protein